MASDTDGTTISNVALKWNGTRDTWGSTFSALPYPGAYTIELTDVGGNVLASGTLTVR